MSSQRPEDKNPDPENEELPMANYDPNDPQRPAGKPETYVEPVERRASPLPLIIGILLALAIAYFVLQYFMGRNEVATTGEDAP